MTISNKVKVRDRLAPTVRDIQRDLGIKSTATVQTLIERLREKGYLKKNKRSEDKAPGAVGRKGSIDLCENVIIDNKDNLSVPVLGEIAAGKPILASENHMYYIDFPKREGYNPQDDFFGLVVKGNSMTGIGIMNGDIVIVAKTGDVTNGDIVAAMIDGEATVKRFFKEDGHFRLQPENPEMKPIIVNELSILARLFGCEILFLKKHHKDYTYYK